MDTPQLFNLPVDVLKYGLSYGEFDLMNYCNWLLKYALVVFIIFSPLQVFAATSSTDTAKEISSDLETQMLAWNRGDIATFVKSYHNSPATLYVSSTVIQGYQAILNRYLTQYASKQKMGKLSYSIVEIKSLSPNYAMVIGKWHLTRKKIKDVGGIFTLLYGKTPEGWKIEVDHTS